MTRFDDLDRGLRAYFEAETLASVPEGVLDTVMKSTAALPPRSVWSARLRHAEISVGVGSRGWTGSVLRVVVLGLLLVAALGATLAVGSWWLDRPPLSGFSASIPAPVTESNPMIRLLDGQTLVFGTLIGDRQTGVSVVTPTSGSLRLIGQTAFAPDRLAVLADGRVLVNGEGLIDGTRRTTYEVFDPASGTSVPLGEAGLAPRSATAVDVDTVDPIPLPDGSVVLLSWDGVHRLDLSDGSSERVGPMPFDGLERSVTLPDGRVVVISDFNSGLATPSLPVTQRVAIFDPGTLTFRSLPPLPEARIGYSLTALRDGTVLIAGGARAHPDASDATPMATAWRLDPRTGAYQPTGPMLEPRWFHGAALLADGRVLLAGGSAERAPDGMDASFPFTPERSTQWYDPDDGRFHAGPFLSEARVSPVVSALADGSVLVMGGSGSGPDHGGAVQSLEMGR